jgi:hypothetical protein
MNILVFSSISWSFLWQRPQHIASELAKRGHRIVFFNEPHYLENPEKFKSLYRQKKMLSLSEVEPNLWVANFFLPPFRGRLSPLRDRMFRRYLSQIMDKLKFQPDAALYYCLRFFPLLKTLQAQNVKVAFDYVDDLTAFPEFASSPYEQMQFGLIRASEVVFATSKLLCSRVISAGSKCVYLPNAMDFNHFNAAATQKILLAELSSLKPPVIGYIGAFNNWVDADLVDRKSTRLNSSH